MTIAISDIAVGKCFRTKNNQVRRVLEANGNDVVYESRGRKLPPKGEFWGPKTTAKADTFANDVEAEVDCNWDPDFQNQQP